MQESSSHGAMGLVSTACGAELGVGDMLEELVVGGEDDVATATFSVSHASSAPTPAEAGRVGRHSEAVLTPLAAAAASGDQPRGAGSMR